MSKHYSKSQIKDKVDSKESEQEITELCLCESRKLVLRPNLLYRFKVYEDCADCVELGKYADSHEDEEMPHKAQIDDLIYQITKDWTPCTPEELRSATEVFLKRFK